MSRVFPYEISVGSLSISVNIMWDPGARTPLSPHFRPISLVLLLFYVRVQMRERTNE